MTELKCFSVKVGLVTRVMMAVRAVFFSRLLQVDDPARPCRRSLFNVFIKAAELRR